MTYSKVNSDELVSLLANLRRQTTMGVLTYEQAKFKSQPILTELNSRAKKIAKKHGKRHYDWKFTGFRDRPIHVR